MRITLKLYATLTDYLPPDARGANLMQLEAGEGATIASILAPYGIPERLVHLVLVNGVYIPPDARASHAFRDADVLAVWPPIAGG